MGKFSFGETNDRGIRLLNLRRASLISGHLITESNVVFNQWLGTARTCTTFSWRQMLTSFKTTRPDPANLQPFQYYEKRSKEQYIVWREESHVASTMWQLSWIIKVKKQQKPLCQRVWEWKEWTQSLIIPFPKTETANSVRTTKQGLSATQVKSCCNTEPYWCYCWGICWLRQRRSTVQHIFNCHTLMKCFQHLHRL